MTQIVKLMKVTVVSNLILILTVALTTTVQLTKRLLRVITYLLQTIAAHKNLRPTLITLRGNQS